MSYEYVSKNEYAPTKAEVEKIIQLLHKKVKEKNKEFTFRHRLVGSANRHLITRVKGGNKGYDFDYNLILNCPPGKYWLAKYSKELILNALREIVEGTIYDYPENSKSAITIKFKDKENSKIIHSVDFGIVYYPYNSEDFDGFKILKAIKTGRGIRYIWEKRKNSNNIDYKFQWLNENVIGYWNEVREKYLYLKNLEINKNKRSYSIYLEVINNLYNKYHKKYVNSISIVYN